MMDNLITHSGRREVLLAANTPAACFEKTFEIAEEFCKELAGREPLRVVFRDFGFKDDIIWSRSSSLCHPILR